MQTAIPAVKKEQDIPPLEIVWRLLSLLGVLLLFFISIKLMGSSMKAFTEGFAGEALNRAADNPLIGLFIGILVTSLVQSSSTVTSLLVGLVAAGAFPLRTAIPIVMGANIGTTITNTIVSLGHIRRKDEFSRAFTAATVHDFFNVSAVIVIFPLEQITHFLEKSAVFLTHILVGKEINEVSGLEHAIKPIVSWIMDISPNEGFSLAIGLIGLFISLSLFVKLMRSILLRKLSVAIDKFVFGRAFNSFLAGLIITGIVQSSSVTTSLVVPLAGAGILTVEQIFPYTLGANIGTTFTALLAAMAFAATGSSSSGTTATLGLTLALVHLLFNISGIVIFYPLRIVPIKLAKLFGKAATKSNRALATAIGVYFLCYLIPLVIYFVTR